MAYYLKATFWYLQGRKAYTRTGFESSSKNFKPLDDFAAQGMSFMVTGGSTGIGREVALSLAKKQGTNVHIVCRNPKNGEDALEAIKNAKHPESEIYLHLVDLSDPIEVTKFSKTFISQGFKLNVLINNAGILSNTLEYNKWGIERSFCLNVLAVYFLTRDFAQHLVSSSSNSSKARVIFVSSGGMLTSTLNHEKPEYVPMPFDGVAAYAHHKRQQVVLADIFSDFYSDIHFSSMHPGWVDTPGVESSLPSFYSRMKNNLRTPSQGADTIIWLALAPEVLNYKTGTFFFDRKPAKKFLFLK